MKMSLRALLCTPLLALLAGSLQLRAQTPNISNAGIIPTTSVAKDSIGQDAVLTLISTIPVDTTLPPGIPVKSKFDFNTGKAGVWGYIFYSPSTQKTINLVYGVLLGSPVIQSLGQTSPFPPSTTPLDTTLPFSKSDMMAQRLITDTAFQAYPYKMTLAPKFVTLTQTAIPTGIALPDNFPTNQQMWTILYQGGDDTTMACFVGAQTGDVFCQRVSAPPLSSVPQTGGVQGTAAISVAPNPANGRTRVTIDIPEGVRLSSGIELGLYNAAGTKVLDLGENFRSNDMRFAEFDSSLLPSGVYYCRATGSNWNGAIGVVVGK